MKIINDTLKYRGKWSRKSLTTFFAFFSAIFYGVVSPIVFKTEPKQFIFDGLLLLTAATLSLTVWDKKKALKNSESNEESN